MSLDKYIWINQQNFIIFGAGILGKELIDLFGHHDIFIGFIDNNTEKQKTLYMNYPVFSFEKYLKNYREYKIILACSIENKSILQDQMINAGLISQRDFIYVADFLKNIVKYYLLKNFNEVWMDIAQICVTERCTLKCKKCAHGCYNVPNNAKDMDLSEVKKSADSFFSHVDYIKQFHLIGGEPFLYSNLSEAIIYIGEKYINQIGRFCITTNGTIIPKDEILKTIKKYNMKILISNYSHTLPRLKSQYEKLIQIMKSYNIDFVFKDVELIWFDFGFDHVDRGFFKDGVNKQEKINKLKEVFLVCKTPCREVRGNKLYFCVQARTCTDNLHFNVGADEYLDLDKLGNDYKSKKIIVDLEMGNIPKGYLDMCNYCNGNDRFQFPIPAAEQKE